jgi:hypothetical protein
MFTTKGLMKSMVGGFSEVSRLRNEMIETAQSAVEDEIKGAWSSTRQRDSGGESEKERVDSRRKNETRRDGGG